MNPQFRNANPNQFGGQFHGNMFPRQEEQPMDGGGEWEAQQFPNNIGNMNQFGENNNFPNFDYSDNFNESRDFGNSREMRDPNDMRQAGNMRSHGIDFSRNVERGGEDFQGGDGVHGRQAPRNENTGGVGENRFAADRQENRQRWKYCTYCDMKFSEERHYMFHCRGVLHTSKVSDFNNRQRQQNADGGTGPSQFKQGFHMNKPRHQSTTPGGSVTSLMDMELGDGGEELPPNTQFSTPPGLPSSGNQMSVTGGNEYMDPAVSKMSGEHGNIRKPSETWRGNKAAAPDLSSCKICNVDKPKTNHFTGRPHFSRVFTQMLALGPEVFMETYADSNLPGSAKTSVPPYFTNYCSQREMKRVGTEQDLFELFCYRSGVFLKLKCRLCSFGARDLDQWMNHIRGVKHTKNSYQAIESSSMERFMKLYHNIPAPFMKKSLTTLPAFKELQSLYPSRFDPDPDEWQQKGTGGAAVEFETPEFINKALQLSECKVCSVKYAQTAHFTGMPHFQRVFGKMLEVGPDQFVEMFPNTDPARKNISPYECNYATESDMRKAGMERDWYELFCYRCGVFNKFKCKLCLSVADDLGRWMGHVKGTKHITNCSGFVEGFGREKFLSRHEKLPAPFLKENLLALPDYIELQKLYPSRFDPMWELSPQKARDETIIPSEGGQQDSGNQEIGMNRPASDSSRNEVANRNRQFRDSSRNEAANENRRFTDHSRDEATNRNRPFSDRSRNEGTDRNRPFSDSSRNEGTDRNRPFSDSSRNEGTNRNRHFNDGFQNEAANRNRPFSDPSQNQGTDWKASFGEPLQNEATNRNRLFGDRSRNQGSDWNRSFDDASHNQAGKRNRPYDDLSQNQVTNRSRPLGDRSQNQGADWDRPFNDCRQNEAAIMNRPLSDRFQDASRGVGPPGEVENIGSNSGPGARFPEKDFPEFRSDNRADRPAGPDFADRSRMGNRPPQDEFVAEGRGRLFRNFDERVSDGNGPRPSHPDQTNPEYPARGFPARASPEPFRADSHGMGRGPGSFNTSQKDRPTDWRDRDHISTGRNPDETFPEPFPDNIGRDRIHRLQDNDERVGRERPVGGDTFPDRSVGFIPFRSPEERHTRQGRPYDRRFPDSNTEDVSLQVGSLDGMTAMNRPFTGNRPDFSPATSQPVELFNDRRDMVTADGRHRDNTMSNYDHRNRDIPAADENTMIDRRRPVQRDDHQETFYDNNPREAAGPVQLHDMSRRPEGASLDYLTRDITKPLQRPDMLIPDGRRLEGTFPEGIARDQIQQGQRLNMTKPGNISLEENVSEYNARDRFESMQRPDLNRTGDTRRGQAFPEYSARDRIDSVQRYDLDRNSDMRRGETFPDYNSRERRGSDLVRPGDRRPAEDFPVQYTTEMPITRPGGIRPVEIPSNLNAQAILECLEGINRGEAFPAHRTDRFNRPDMIGLDGDQSARSFPDVRDTLDPFPRHDVTESRRIGPEEGYRISDVMDRNRSGEQDQLPKEKLDEWMQQNRDIHLDGMVGEMQQIPPYDGIHPRSPSHGGNFNRFPNEYRDDRLRDDITFDSRSPERRESDRRGGSSNGKDRGGSLDRRAQNINRGSADRSNRNEASWDSRENMHHRASRDRSDRPVRSPDSRRRSRDRDGNHSRQGSQARGNLDRPRISRDKDGNDSRKGTRGRSDTDRRRKSRSPPHGRRDRSRERRDRNHRMGSRERNLKDRGVSKERSVHGGESRTRSNHGGDSRTRSNRRGDSRGRNVHSGDSRTRGDHRRVDNERASGRPDSDGATRDRTSRPSRGGERRRDDARSDRTRPRRSRSPVSRSRAHVENPTRQVANERARNAGGAGINHDSVIDLTGDSHRGSHQIDVTHSRMPPNEGPYLEMI